MAESTTWEVSAAANADIPVLIELMHVFYAESSFPLDHDWAHGSFRTLLANPVLGCVWLIRHSGQAVGHAVLSVRYAMEFGGLCGYVDDLYIRPEFRRKGAGAALMATILAECHSRGCKSLQVEVGESNIPAILLYQRFGLKAHTDGRILLSGTIDEHGGVRPSFAPLPTPKTPAGVIAGLIAILESLRERKPMYFQPIEPRAVIDWLSGLRTGVALAGVEWDGLHREPGLSRRGLEATSVWEDEELARRGLNSEAIVDELLAIEIEMWQTVRANISSEIQGGPDFRPADDSLC